MVELNLQKRDLKQRSEKGAHSSEYPKNYQNNSLKIFDVVLTTICALFFIFLFAGHYFKNLQELQTFNYLKYAIIPIFSFCIYRYYKTRSKAIFFILLFALTVTWFSGSGFAYHWDSVQHVFRAKYYLTHSYFSVGERHSFIYLIWGAFYRIFGESENVTHLINMFLGIFGIFGIYAIAKELYGDFAGFLALLVSFTFPAFFVVNKWAYLDMPFTSAVIITFFFFFKYLNNRSDGFFYLSLLFAFIAFGIKDPGLVLFPAIFLSLTVYGKMTKKAFISIAIMLLFCVLYYFKVMYYTKIMAEFSTITPLTFGTESTGIWATLLAHETVQYIYSGVLFLSIFAFLKVNEKNKSLVYSLLAVQVLLLIISEAYPSKQIFYFPLLPAGNYLPYSFLLGLAVLCVLVFLGLKQVELDTGKKEIVMLLWIAGFSAFFIINAKINVLEYSSNPSLDLINMDFRYLMPAFPALIILFSAGISKILKNNYSEKTRFIVIFIISLTIIFNFIIATNLTFYYAKSSNLRTEGYAELGKQGAELVYTHWPYFYGEGHNIGRLTWEKDNIATKEIISNYYEWSASNTFLLFDTSFYSPEKVINFESEKIEATTYLLSPLSSSITQEIVNTVYIGRLKRGSIVLGDGFYDLEYWNGIPTNWIGDSANFQIYSDKVVNATLIMRAESFMHKRTLEIYVNKEPVFVSSVPAENFEYIKVPVKLRKGSNFVYLNVPEGSDIPATISGSGAEDSRALSVAFQDLKLKSNQ